MLESKSSAVSASSTAASLFSVASKLRARLVLAFATRARLSYDCDFSYFCSTVLLTERRAVTAAS
jgi:hypothetical protein